MIPRLIEVLNSVGRELSGREVAEILWLAPFLAQQSVSEGAQARPPDTSLSPIPLDTPDSTKSKQPGKEGAQSEQEETRNTVEQRPRPEVDSRVDVAVSSNQGARAGMKLVQFRSPAAPALPHALSIARALRTLKRSIRSRRTLELDEVSTVEAIARGGPWVPVLRPGRERWLDVTLVIDSSQSMLLWSDTLKELQALLRHHGAFRDVQTWVLVTQADDGKLLLYRGRKPQSGTPSRSWRELLDPSGRRLMLLVSDCVSTGWHSGAVWNWLREWGKQGPVAILQMLPQRIWGRTALRRSPAVWLRATEPVIPGTRLSFGTVPGIVHLRSRRDRSTDRGMSVGVPVITLERKSMATWARMLTGAPNAWSPGVLLRGGAQHRSTQDQANPGASPELGPAELIERFDSLASVTARRLARLLAAAPLSIRIMQVVREVSLPEAEQVHLAEVFLSGLIEETGSAQTSWNPDVVQYEFAPGVRQMLLESTQVPDSIDVLQKVSKYIESRIGQPLNFPAFLQDPSSSDVEKLGAAHQPFARVAASVLRQLGGAYANLADRLEATLAGRNLLDVSDGATSQAEAVKSGWAVRGEVAVTNGLFPGRTTSSLSSFSSDLRMMLSQPFSLFLGKVWGREQEPSLKKFTRQLDAALGHESSDLPLSAVSQQYASQFGKDSLYAGFQQAFGHESLSQPFVDALANRMGPGVHVSFLRSPLLEEALARQHLELTLYVVHVPQARSTQRAAEGIVVLRRPGSGKDWEVLKSLPTTLDLSCECLVLRPYGGYLPRRTYVRPLLSEDDFLLGVSRPASMVPSDLADEVLSRLLDRPALMLGMSILTWHHRMLLQQFFGRRAVPTGSMALLEPGTSERTLWQLGGGLPGGASVQVIEAEFVELVEPLKELSHS